MTNHARLDNFGVMEKTRVITQLAALAQESRLDIVRFLVRRGTDGVAAGRIGKQFNLPSATLSFHLNTLTAAGLITRQRNGRQNLYSADISSVQALSAYLLENCCTETQSQTTPADTINAA